jgi:hypothetical protein
LTLATPFYRDSSYTRFRLHGTVYLAQLLQCTYLLIQCPQLIHVHILPSPHPSLQIDCIRYLAKVIREQLKKYVRAVSIYRVQFLFIIEFLLLLYLLLGLYLSYSFNESACWVLLEDMLEMDGWRG